MSILSNERSVSSSRGIESSRNRTDFPADRAEPIARSLAAGKLRAPLAGDGRVALPGRRDEVVDVRQASGALHLRLGYLLVVQAKSDIASNAVVEEE